MTKAKIKPEVKTVIQKHFIVPLSKKMWDGDAFVKLEKENDYFKVTISTSSEVEYYCFTKEDLLNMVTGIELILEEEEK